MLSQHFIDEKDDIKPWVFYPRENIKSISTSKHRGYLTIRDAGKGEDIIGSLKDPIRIDDYPLPWEFQLGMLQHLALPAANGKQTNRAYGLNLAVTFSDPSSWPADRTQKPPQTHTLQLLVVRLGHYGEMGNDGGIPQARFSAANYGDPSAEICMLYGRGDLAPNVLGDWEIPYAWAGYQPPQAGQLGCAASWSWNKSGGPAESNGLQDIRFRVRLLSPTKLEVGFGWGYRSGSWRMRTIDVSQFGKITGIWDVGPVVALDDWICKELPQKISIKPPLVLDPPIKEHEYYFDYAQFFGQGPECFDHFSQDFEIPNMPADFKWFIECDGFFDTWSHPGYLTVTFAGKQGSWGMCPMIDAENTPGLGYIELAKIPPPMEFEMAFIAEDDGIPWNIWHSFVLTDETGKGHTWSPGIQNIPGQGRSYINMHPEDPHQFNRKSEVTLAFDPEPPQSVLTHKPLRIRLQVIDSTHIRVGLKGPEDGPWYNSNIFDTAPLFGPISKFSLPCIVSSVAQDGSGIGNYPHLQQFLLDYIAYRHHLSD